MKVCKYCQKEFEDKKHPSKEYCTRNCWKIGIKQERGIPCEVCGKTFIDRHKYRNGRKFCSWKCRIQSKDSKFTCLNCGVSYRVTVSSKQKFCSPKCSNQYNRVSDASKKSIFTCLFCGKEFEGWTYRKTKFCSFLCKNRYGGKKRGEQLYKPDSTKSRGMNWKHQAAIARKRDNYTCQVCGRHGWVDRFLVQVHHIIPYRLFKGDHEKANSLNNLVSLCPSCHPKVEAGIVKLPQKVLERSQE